MRLDDRRLKKKQFKLYKEVYYAKYYNFTAR